MSFDARSLFLGLNRACNCVCDNLWLDGLKMAKWACSRDV